ncbi:DUF1963 domain-containing protein [Nocardioides sp. CCNWLW239]|uniref:DUF1963 domain-containing protein n=1 Tax=Nocardioides sp. CCNWLW239 TaxID=3128902 RepID=UPI00301B6984
MHPFRDLARERGIALDEVERWLETTTRPCASLGGSPDGPVAGRFGGLPPMPEDEPVPDLPFLAVVDLAAVPPDATDLPLPRDGTILFFADTSGSVPWTRRDWFRLLYVPAGTPVSERGPIDEQRRQVHPPHDLHLAFDPSLPNRGDHYSDTFRHGDELGEVWWDVSGDLQTGGQVQIGGYPWVWNKDPVHEHHHGPDDWVLFAELATDEGLLGNVHWVIRRDDLAAGRFATARASYDTGG